jgi:hypothetical protein
MNLAPARCRRRAGIYFAKLGTMLAIGYILGAVMTVLGALVLLGFFELRSADPASGAMLRTMFGIVLMLYGIYRIAVSEMTRRRRAYERHVHDPGH